MYINYLATGILPLPAQSPVRSDQKSDTTGTGHVFNSSSIESSYLRSLPADTASPNTHQQFQNTERVLGLGILLFFSLLVLVKFFNIKDRLKFAPNSSKKKPVNRIPCTSCDYFSDNFYLRCAIHPYAALTEQAVDCRDFCPKRKGRPREIIEK